MLPIYKVKNHVFNYDEIPAGYYYEVAQKGSAVQKFWHRHKFLSVLRHVEGAKSLADYGCGPGTFLSILGEVNPEIRAVGVDLGSKQIEFAKREIAPKFPGGRISFEALTSEQPTMSALDHSLDAVTSIEVIEHLHPFYAHQLLLESRRVLKPEGKLVITTPNYRSLWPLIEFGLERMSPVKYHDQHISKFTPSALVKFVESAGFTVEKVETTFVIAPFLAGLSKPLAEALLKLEAALFPSIGSLLVVVAKPMA